MARILVLHNKPSHQGAFNKYYFERHVPIANRIPGLRTNTVGKGDPIALTGTAPYLVAELGFHLIVDLQAAHASPDGEATAADVANFAHAGAAMLIPERVSYR
jgi:uncharacterized protein (TIGR02118 family)